MAFSDLEMLVMADMYDHGYDPSFPDDVEEYWKDYFNGY